MPPLHTITLETDGADVDEKIAGQGATFYQAAADLLNRLSNGEPPSAMVFEMLAELARQEVPGTVTDYDMAAMEVTFLLTWEIKEVLASQAA